MSRDPEEGRLRRGEGSVPRATSDSGSAGQRGAAVTAVAPTSAPISSLSSLFLPLTVLQLSLLPSSLMTRTQPQAEVQMTPSAVAVAVARG